jgi:hypothetical protein
VHHTVERAQGVLKLGRRRVGDGVAHKYRKVFDQQHPLVRPFRNEHKKGGPRYPSQFIVEGKRRSKHYPNQVE